MTQHDYLAKAIAGGVIAGAAKTTDYLANVVRNPEHSDHLLQDPPMEQSQQSYRPIPGLLPSPSDFSKEDLERLHGEQSAKVKFKIKGAEDGPVYQGQEIVVSCPTCPQNT